MKYTKIEGKVQVLYQAEQDPKKSQLGVDGMNNQIIFFDLDDTLVHCNKYFHLVIEQFADQMKTWFSGYDISQEQIKQKQLELDIASVHLHGFIKEHFPQSFVDTYEYFADIEGRIKSKKEIFWLRQLGYSVYEQDIEPYPYMNETLQDLKKRGHELYLYTGGDVAIQQKKVKQMGLEPFFNNRIIITQHKTTTFLESILIKEQFDRTKTWMIGNSIRTDVLPALETGIHAIYIPAVTEWQYNIAEIHAKPKGAFLKLSALHQVPEAIHSYNQ